MKEKIRKRKKVIITILVVCALIAVVGITYAFITQVLTGEKQVVINAGVLDLVLEEENEITISDALPMYDQVGMIQEEVFKFRLVNKTNNLTNYKLKLTKIKSDNELSPSNVKYYLTKEGKGKPKLLSSLPVDGTVDSGIITGNDTIDYTLRLWIDSKVTDQTKISGKRLSYKVIIDASMVVEYKVTFDTDDGNQVTTNTYIEGQKYKQLPIPTREGYEFEGWYTEEGDLVTEDSIVSKITNDTLYAQWTNLQATLPEQWTYPGYYSYLYIEKIETIEFVPYLTSISDAVDYWDLSENNDESFMAYISETTTGGYRLTFTSDQEMFLPEDSSFLFADFAALTEIIGLEYVNTSQVTNMSYMFRGGYYSDSQLQYLDLSNFDTTNVTNMSSMFYGCKALTNLDLSSFDTSNVTDMISMFSGCINLTTTLKIVGPGSSNPYYSDMFYDTSINSGTVTVYSDGTNDELVQKMVNTKSSNSNVVYGGVAQ